ncbi:unnamed protein product, partial [Thlaspi arvense]
GVGGQVVRITNQKPPEADEVMYSLEHNMLDRGVQIISAKGHKAIDTALKVDLIVLNTAVAGKWLDAVLKEDVRKVLPKILWWIHEMRDHYFKPDLVKNLPFVAGAMIDSHATADYWKNRTHLGIKMPKTYIVHLGNSKELMEVVEDSVSKRVLREHVRESLEGKKDIWIATKTKKRKKKKQGHSRNGMRLNTIENEEPAIKHVASDEMELNIAYILDRIESFAHIVSFVLFLYVSNLLKSGKTTLTELGNQFEEGLIM